MAIKTVRLGGVEQALAYDDALYDCAIETTEPIRAGTPTLSNEVLRLGDVGTVMWPVGSIFLSVVSTNPATLLGFGTWAAIAEGRMLVGYKAADADFGTVEGVGGAKALNAAHSAHAGAAVDAHTTATAVGAVGTTFLTGPGTHTVTQPSAHSNHVDSILNPFFTIYAWKRTA